MKHLIMLPALFLAAACTYSTQTTSGADYVSSSPNGVARAIDANIAAVASVEPQLSFPARIGIARVVNGQLSLPPVGELQLFADVAQRYPHAGEFVPVSPLVMAMVTDNGSNVSSSDHYSRHNTAAEVINDIRLASARQHLDYVLIYEIGARSRTGDTPFALADVTIIGGMLLPTRNIRVAAVGAAILVDVRNGYPYGTVQVAEDVSGLGRSWASERRTDSLRNQAALKVARSLVPEVEEMLAELIAKAG